MKTEIYNNEYYYRCIEYMIKNNILIEKNNILKNKKAKIRFNKLSLEIDLIRTEKLDKLFNILKILINKYIFILSIFCFLIIVKSLTMISFRVEFSNFENFCIVLLVILSMIIHELGHLSGCKKFNVNTGFLGVGLYIIIPRIYVGIKNIWTIDNSSRFILESNELLGNTCKTHKKIELQNDINYCDKCSIKNYCNAQCKFINKLYTGNILKPPKFFCDIQKILFYHIYKTFV